MNKQAILKHLAVSRQYADQLQDIMRPLFSRSLVKFFSYNRFYHHQTWIGLYSDPTPVEGDLLAGRGPLFVDAQGICIKEGIYVHKDLEDILKIEVNPALVANFFLQKENPKGLEVVQNGLLIIRKGIHYDESFYFSLMDSSVSDRYYFYAIINDLKKYCVYFLNKAKKIIISAEEKKIKYVVPEKNLQQFDALFFRATGDSVLSVKKFCFATAYGDVFLSEQELNCLRLIAGGCSQQEIAGKLSLSPKTVESYVRGIKNKLVADTKEELTCHYRSFAAIDYMAS